MRTPVAMPLDTNLAARLGTHIFAVLLFIGQHLSGQIDNVTILNNQIKVSPCRVLGPDRGLELNYERRFTPKFSAQLTARHIVDIFKNTRQRSYDKLTGFALYFEPKYYVDLGIKTRTFISTSIGHLRCTFENIDDFINTNADTINKLSYYFEDTVNIDRRVSDLNLNCGIQKIFNKVVLEFSAGLGLRYREVRLSGKLYSDEIIWRGRHEIFPFHHSEGSFYTLNIPLRLKIGYSF
jgi:hypothetical protein